MTQMPELVAGMHALVGLAAVFVGFNADLEIKNVAIALDAGSSGCVIEGKIKRVLMPKPAH